MAADVKGMNVEEALRKAGYDSMQLSRIQSRIDGKRETVYFYMVWNRSRNAFHPGTDIRTELDKENIQEIADVAQKIGLLTFIDKEFRHMDMAHHFLEPGHHEVGMIFFPSHIVGRLKRVVSKASKDIVTLVPFLQEDVAYTNVLENLKKTQQNLLTATKYALVDEEEEMATDSFNALRMALSVVRHDLQAFRNAVGIPLNEGASLTKRQEEADLAIRDAYHLAGSFRKVL